jgi:O-antigen ligase
VETIPLTITDISGLIVIGAGILDFLLNNKAMEKAPRLSANFILLIIALAFCAVFAYDIQLAFRATSRVALLLLVFISLGRLMSTTGVVFPLKLFFWLCTLNSIVVVGTFIAGGGSFRAFGFAEKFFDEISMLTFPIGIAFYLWSPAGKSGKYLVGSLLILAALISTQSRAPLLFSIFITSLVFVVSWWRYRRIKKAKQLNSKDDLPPVQKRLFAVTFVTLACLSVAIISAPSLFETIQARFTDIITLADSSTVWKRLVLWSNAFSAFLDHPLTGVGPGNYKVIHTIYPTVQLEYIHFFVRGMNAHNLVMQYLAESGIVGTIPMILLMFNQFRLSRQSWAQAVNLKSIRHSLALYSAGATLLITTVLEADWLWGFAGYTFVFFITLISKNHAEETKLKME